MKTLLTLFAVLALPTLLLAGSGRSDDSNAQSVARDETSVAKDIDVDRSHDSCGHLQSRLPLLPQRKLVHDHGRRTLLLYPLLL
jgi:hypothetical protein